MDYSSDDVDRITLSEKSDIGIIVDEKMNKAEYEFMYKVLWARLQKIYVFAETNLIKVEETSGDDKE